MVEWFNHTSRTALRKYAARNWQTLFHHEQTRALNHNIHNVVFVITTNLDIKWKYTVLVDVLSRVNCWLLYVYMSAINHTQTLWYWENMKEVGHFFIHFFFSSWKVEVVRSHVSCDSIFHPSYSYWQTPDSPNALAVFSQSAFVNQVV